MFPRGIELPTNSCVEHGDNASEPNRPEVSHARPQLFQTETTSLANRREGSSDPEILEGGAFLRQDTVDYNKVLEAGYEIFVVLKEFCN